MAPKSQWRLKNPSSVKSTIRLIDFWEAIGARKSKLSKEGLKLKKGGSGHNEDTRGRIKVAM